MSQRSLSSHADESVGSDVCNSIAALGTGRGSGCSDLWPRGQGLRPLMPWCSVTEFWRIFSISFFLSASEWKKEGKGPSKNAKNLSQPQFPHTTTWLNSPPFFLAPITCVLGLDDDSGALQILIYRRPSTQRHPMAQNSCKNLPGESRVPKMNKFKIKLTLIWHIFTFLSVCPYCATTLF